MPDILYSTHYLFGSIFQFPSVRPFVKRFWQLKVGQKVMWFGPKWTCCLGENPCYHGGDAMMLGILTDKHANGAWCDYDSTSLRDFICKARIEWMK